jgi:hypothetical protein
MQLSEIVNAVRSIMNRTFGDHLPFVSKIETKTSNPKWVDECLLERAESKREAKKGKRIAS